MEEPVWRHAGFRIAPPEGSGDGERGAEAPFGGELCPKVGDGHDQAAV